jgi:hypothetical protein
MGGREGPESSLGFVAGYVLEGYKSPGQIYNSTWPPRKHTDWLFHPLTHRFQVLKMQERERDLRNGITPGSTCQTES